MAEDETSRSLQIMSLARELAASAEFDNDLEIEAELLRQGHSDAPTFLCDGTIHLE